MKIIFSFIMLSGVAMTSNSALADDKSPFEVYGQVHVSLDYLDNSKDPTFAASSNSSRLGVKGQYQLDDGLTATFGMEYQVATTDDAKSLSRRNSYAALKGNFGQILVGRYDTPMKKLGRSVDLFWSSQLGENRTITNSNSFDARYDNAVHYSYKFSDIKFMTAFYIDAGVTSDRIDDDSANVSSTSVVYEKGAVMLGGGYEIVSGKSQYSELGFPDKEDATGLRLVGSYKMGDHKLAGFFESAADVSGTAGKDRNLYGVGWSLKKGKYLYKAQVYSADDFDNTDNTGATLMSAGVDYSYSKKVEVYAVVSRMANDQAAKFAIVGVGHDDKLDVIIGEDNAGVSIGTRIKF